MALVRRPPETASPAAAPPSETTLRTGTTEERWAAARAMGSDPASVEILAAVLPSETVPHVREAILTGLARAGTPAAAALILPLLRSDTARDRTLALDALRTMPAAIGSLLPTLLHDPDPDVRLLASDLARILPPEAATAILVAVLTEDGEANVCAAAIEVLSESGSREALPALRLVAARFPEDPFISFAAEAAILRIGSDPQQP